MATSEADSEGCNLPPSPPKNFNREGVMVKQLKTYKWSNEFLALLSNESRALDMVQYDFCVDEWKSAHDKKTIINYLIAILLFCAGLWAVYEHAVFVAVLL